MPDYKRLITVSLLGLGQLIAFGSSLYLLTALAGAMVRDTGWPLPWVVGGYSFAALVSATTSALAGRYVGAGQGHLVLAISSCLFAAGLLLMAISPNLVVYFAAWGILGLAMSCGLYDAAFGTAGRLFGPAARSSIIQIALWGGFASTTFWPLSHVLEAHFGWRATLSVFAGIHLGIGLPIYLFALPRPHDAVDAAQAHRHVVTPPQGAEWPIYLTLGVVIAMEMSIVAVMSVHMDAILLGRGLTLTAAVGLSAFVGPSQVLARVVELTLGRRWPPYLSLCLGVITLTIGVAIIALNGALSLPGLMLYGAGLGVASITSGTVPLAIFGPERYPPLMGRLRRINLVLQAISPFAGAWLLGRAGVNALLVAIIVMALISVVMATWLAMRCHAFLRRRGEPVGE